MCIVLSDTVATTLLDHVWPITVRTNGATPARIVFDMDGDFLIAELTGDAGRCLVNLTMPSMAVQFQAADRMYLIVDSFVRDLSLDQANPWVPPKDDPSAQEGLVCYGMDVESREKRLWRMIYHRNDHGELSHDEVTSEERDLTGSIFRLLGRVCDAIEIVRRIP